MKQYLELYTALIKIVFMGVFSFSLACSSDDAPATTAPDTGIPMPDASGNLQQSLSHDGEERSYIVHLPPNFSKAQTLPLMISLHGRGTTNTVHMQYTKLNAVADAQNFVVVYPLGLVRNLQSGTATHWNAQFGTGVDDIGFIDKLIDQLYTDFGIDLQKVYVSGFSNGGFMAYTLACELSDRIAAIAPVSALLPISQQSNCELQHAVPVLHFHGTADVTVPVSGIPNFALSVAESTRFFAKQYNCEVDPLVTQLTDTAPDDGSTVAKFEYQSCDDKTAVVYYMATNAGHTWPDALEASQLGITNRDINASAIMWEFFKPITHPNPRKGTLLK